MLTEGQTDAGVTGILIAHLGAFGSGELIIFLIPQNLCSSEHLLALQLCDGTLVLGR